MNVSSPILLFILASAGIHAGLVIISNTSDITLPGYSGSVMVVQIKNKHFSKAIKPEAVKKGITTIEKDIANIKIPSKNKNRKKSTPIETASIDKNSSTSKARVASILYKELNQYFTYPRLAIKQSWQGKVLLSLRVTSNGEIKNIQLNSSSGYDVLDQAAINSLSKVEQLPEISSWLPFDIDLEFPVIYKLIEG